MRASKAMSSSWNSASVDDVAHRLEKLNRTDFQRRYSYDPMQLSKISNLLLLIRHRQSLVTVTHWNFLAVPSVCDVLANREMGPGLFL